MKPFAPFPKHWSEKAFQRLALELFEFQKQTNPVYAAYCRQSGAAPVRRWQDFPALPVSAFKFHRVACFPKSKTIRTFMTSGTTRGSLRGNHGYASLEAYDDTVRTLFKEYVLPDLADAAKIETVFLVQPPAERPESSLSYMASRVQKEFGAEQAFWALGKKGIRDRELTACLLKARRPILIFSTTFALADYLDFLEAGEIRFRLPSGSRILETGGYKGRRTEVARPALLKRIAALMGIPPERVINEYGMTELTSQFYDLSLQRKRTTSVKGIAPWTRILIVDPRTGRTVPRGRRGMIRVIDLANRGSCLAVQTEDEGRLVPGGFEILGRRKGADLRGCSLTFEEMKGLAS